MRGAAEPRVARGRLEILFLCTKAVVGGSQAKGKEQEGEVTGRGQEGGREVGAD